MNCWLQRAESKPNENFPARMGAQCCSHTYKSWAHKFCRWKWSCTNADCVILGLGYYGGRVKKVHSELSNASVSYKNWRIFWCYFGSDILGSGTLRLQCLCVDCAYACEREQELLWPIFLVKYSIIDENWIIMEGPDRLNPSFARVNCFFLATKSAVMFGNDLIETENSTRALTHHHLI